MLVLSRKQGEKIFIGDDIEVSIISVDGDRVRIGIDAPLDIEILRGELLDETKELNKRAAHISAMNLTDIKKMMEKRG